MLTPVLSFFFCGDASFDWVCFCVPVVLSKILWIDWAFSHFFLFFFCCCCCFCKLMQDQACYFMNLRWIAMYRARQEDSYCPYCFVKEWMETFVWSTQVRLHTLMNPFCTVERGPCSSWLCSCHLWNKSLVPRTPLLLSWKTQPKWTWFQNELPSYEGRELYHGLLHCFYVQIGKNTMASQRNISFISIGHVLFMDCDSEHKVYDLDDGMGA